MTTFKCDCCNFTTPKKTNYTAHLNTIKHRNKYTIPETSLYENNIVTQDYETENETKTPHDIYTCITCNKNYISYKSYWYHVTKSKCKKHNKEKHHVENDEAKEDIHMLQQTIQDMLKIQSKTAEQNAHQLEQYTHIIELLKTNNAGTVINNHQNNNIQQNNFNLNVFLNEQCKDALNITDYINNIQLHFEDLQATAQLGYTDGITKIINDRVKECGLFNRPFHCTDKKREIVYVKDNNVWEKENSKKPKMKTMISNVIHKNLQQLSKWHEKYPECLNSESKMSNDFLNMMIQANGGSQFDREKKEEIILKNILKEVTVEK